MSNFDNLLKSLSIYTKQTVPNPGIIWLLIGIDYCCIENCGVKGILDFESIQHGSVGSMGKAFIQMLKYISSEDTLDIKSAKSLEQQDCCVKKIEQHLLRYHKLCTENVEVWNQSIRSGAYRTTDISSYRFCLNTKDANGTDAGYKYLSLRSRIRGPKDQDKDPYIENFYGVANKIDGSYKIISIANNTEIEVIVKKLILRLVQDLQEDLADDESLLRICEFIQDMIVLQPFSVANTKTLVNLLLNEILVDIGFAPVVFKRHHIFEAFHPHELILKVREGQNLLHRVVNGIREFSPLLYKNSRAMLTIALRSDSPELLEVAMLYLNIPNDFRHKFSTAVLDFNKISKPPYFIDLLQDEEFLEYFLSVYDNGADAVFATAVILLSLLNDNTSGHQSWHLHFFITCFFKYKFEERTIVDGYFHALAFITYEDNVAGTHIDLLHTLFGSGCSGNNLYKLSSNKVYIILRCIDWYTNLKGLNSDIKESVDKLTETLDANSPINKKLSYEDHRKIKIRIDNVFEQKRRRAFTI